MTKHSIAALCALTLAGFGFAPTSHAEDSLVPTNLTTPTADDGKDVKESKDLKQQCKESCISGDLGVTMPTEYITRGIVAENQGVIAQPYLDLYFKLYEGTGFINKVSFNFGLWSSIHSHVQPDGSTDTTRNWYEFDWTPGIAVTFAKNFTATLSYFEFDSPASAFDTARSINLNLAYDDTDLLGKFALHPHVTYLRELERSRLRRSRRPRMATTMKSAWLRATPPDRSRSARRSPWASATTGSMPVRPSGISLPVSRCPSRSASFLSATGSGPSRVATPTTNSATPWQTRPRPVTRASTCSRARSA